MWLLALTTGLMVICQQSPAKETLLTDTSLWTEDLQAEFNGLDSDKQQYVVAMLSGKWPTEHDNATLITLQSAKVNQIVDGGSAIVGTSLGKLWMTGIDTSSLADDDVVNCQNLVFVSEGNQTYTTVIGGTKTVTKLRGFDIREAHTLAQRVLEPQGYRLFRLKRVSGHPWMIGTVVNLTKLTASVQIHGEKKPVKFSSQNFSELDIAWLSDKDNVKAMQKTRREWDAAEKAKGKSNDDG